MGYSESIDDSNVESISYTEYFEKACPIFMSYGLSYEDFWYGDPYKAKYQKDAYVISLRKQDELMWEQGMYVYEAILECAPILHPFSKAKEPLPYTSQPHLMLMDEDEKKKREEQEAENERLKGLLWARNFVKGMQNKMKNE